MRGVLVLVLVALATWTWLGCNDTGLDGLAFACDDDGDCASGWECAFDSDLLANVCAPASGGGVAGFNPCDSLEVPCSLPGACVETVCVAAGQSRLGCSDGAEGCDAAATPSVVVELDSFLISRSEITRDAFAVFLDSDPDCPGSGCFDVAAPEPPVLFDEVTGSWQAAAPSGRLPMTHVTWWGASEFCAAIDMTLCSETQWESAARGTCEDLGVSCARVDALYPWGDEPPSCELAVMSVDDGTCEGPVAVPAAAGGASSVGVWDLAGNVSEWVADCWHATHDGTPTDGATWTGACDANGHRTVRGGGWDDGASAQRVTWRESEDRNIGRDDLGFRCCRSTPR